MTTVNPTTTPRYVSADMAEAHREALRALEREKAKPAHIREARTKNLLRWLGDGPRT
ncbi:hypothetical protein [Frigoribacterium salinisoli]